MKNMHLSIDTGLVNEHVNSNQVHKLHVFVIISYRTHRNIFLLFAPD